MGGEYNPERFKDDYLIALRTPPGVIYLLTRGLSSALFFLGLYHFGYIKNYLILQAPAIGIEAEIFFRSRVCMRKTQKKGNDIEELSRGPYDLLLWYQGLFLKYIPPHLIESRANFAEKIAEGELTFLELCNNVDNSLSALSDKLVESKVKEGIVKLKRKFKKEQQENNDWNKLEEKCKHDLGFLLLDLVGRKITRVLLKN